MFHRVAEAVVPEAALTAFYAAQRYKNTFGILPNLLHPRTFNEKVLYRMVFDRRPILKTLQDKYAAREYVRERIGERVLARLYWVTKNPADIPFDSLPDRFVVKAAHGSGWNLFVRDKATVNRQDLVKTCTAWLSSNYYFGNREWAYKDIEPRIIVEEFLSDGIGVTPTDYKFHVFGGRVHMIQVDRDRLVDHRRANYGRSWDRLEMTTQYKFLGDVARPPHLDEMVQCAETLGAGLDYIRVDLYDAGKVYFGEMTLYPRAGLEVFRPDEWDHYLGGLWRLSTGPTGLLSYIEKLFEHSVGFARPLRKRKRRATGADGSVG